MNKKAVCEKCVYFNDDAERPFCRAFGCYVRKEKVKRETLCSAFLEKRKVELLLMKWRAKNEID